MKALYENREVDIMVRPTKEEREIHHLIWDEVIVAYDNWLGTDEEWEAMSVLGRVKVEVIEDLYSNSTLSKKKLMQVAEECHCVLCEISDRMRKKEGCGYCDFCHKLAGEWMQKAGCLGGLYDKAIAGNREAMVTIRNLI